jgi:superfamily II DNA or RNA helicase
MIGYWTRNGQRLLVLADEVHHGSNEEQKAWGEALKYAIKHSEISILLSGTFWRSDGHRIPGATYKATDTEGLKGTVAAHYSYNLDKGQRDGVVSLVFFDTVSGTVTYRPRAKKNENEFVEPELITSVIDRHQFDKGKALFTGEAYSNFLNTKHKFAEEIIRKCHEELHQKRLAHFEQFKDVENPPPPPAGLAIAKDTREATKLQTLIKSITGHRPPVVHGKIEDEPTEVIDKFKNGIGEWIVAVKMISEGTDIPRLKVLAYLGHQMTELVFHQTVGRIMRTRYYKDEQGKSHPIEEEGFAVVPEHPILYSFVKRFRDAQVETDLGDDETPKVCPKCGKNPCECPPPPPCPVCGQKPCVCPKTDPFIDSTRATKSTTHLDKHEGVNIHILNFLKSRLPGFDRTTYISAAIDGYGALNVYPDDFGNDNVIY